MNPSDWSLSPWPALLGATVCLQRGARLVETAATALSVRSPSTTLEIDAIPAGLMHTLRLLEAGESSVEELREAALAGAGEQGVTRLRTCLASLSECSLLRYRLTLDDVLSADMVPLGTFRPPSPPESESRRFLLSRFALLRRERDALIVEAPTAHARIEIQPRAEINFLPGREPLTVPQLGRSSGHLPDPEDRLHALLYSVGLLTEVLPDGTVTEDESSAANWEFHDLLFHARSRAGRRGGSYGATKGRVWLGTGATPAPSIGASIPLDRPTQGPGAEAVTGLDLLLRARRSERAHGADPITATQLGGFLFRSAGVVNSASGDPTRGLHTYPSGSGYALGIYALVGRCEDLDPGLYRYRPEAHELDLVSAACPSTAYILDQARSAMAAAHPPQVLIVITARFEHVLPRYRALAYSLLLKDVGVLFQTMYLTGTAMDLATCALGGGNSDLFGAVAGLDYFAESSVGELAIGSRPGPASEEGVR